VEASALSAPAALRRPSWQPVRLLRLRSDEQLVALFRAGSEEAFGVIHERYRQRLFAYARQMLSGSRSDAEDVLQDVFLRAYHALRADRRPIALRAWLYRVAHNRCIDQIRRPAPAPQDVYELNRGVPSDPMAEAERREDLRRLIADVRALPEQQRSALLMREMEGLSYNDLAEALGVTVPAIKSLLVRARVGLVEAIEARDTACVEIRADVAAAFDRGVRASGRSRKHLRECGGCRDYRTALRGIEKQLNGLAPASGPLTTIAKILGIGGAGSGAAAGGGAAVVGGGAGAGAAAAGGTTAATIGTGAVAATATKVAAVVAAAAVVGGGAATVEKVERQHTPATHVRHVAATPATIVVAPQRRVDPVRRVPASARVKTVRGAAVAPHVAHVRTAGDAPVSSAGTDAPRIEPTTGGVQAPDEDATTASNDTTGTDPGGSGTATAGSGTTTGAGSTAASGTATGDGTSGATTTTSSSTPTSGTGATSATGAGGTSAPATSPSGTSTSAPIAQGATAPSAG
jgi:RNA polymerase sigma factor (sigma-70 family)